MTETLAFFTLIGRLVQDRLLQDVPGQVFGKPQALQGARRLQQVQDYVCAAALDRFDASGVFQPASALAELSAQVFQIPDMLLCRYWVHTSLLGRQ